MKNKKNLYPHAVEKLCPADTSGGHFRLLVVLTLGVLLSFCLYVYIQYSNKKEIQTINKTATKAEYFSKDFILILTNYL